MLKFKTSDYKLDGKLDRCLELTLDVPRVEEKHKSLTKGLFTPPCLRWEKGINGCCCELSWTTIKVNLNIDTTNEREKGKGMGLDHK